MWYNENDEHIIKKDFHKFNYRMIALQNELAALPPF
jgi:hypothetical protein